ncbi:hypothetical protein M407DRAFT_22295 [Tulasnella calospora MUT 4182]|uniref:NACHT domain-containing protein n=1 Tax=Tulasnella calospora MUT 4182 TaxID=1051891 RepID=A0A0C3M4F3_9AGAM|nr:hypothetical protein M407DRAFT_22295 [Tulasnella calospora MUT 4182]
MTDPTIDPSIQQLHDKRNSTRNAALSLLTNTNWPSQSKEAAESLLQAINDLPDVPLDASVIPFKDTLVEFIRVLEGAHARVKDVSEKYGRKEIGLLGGIKNKLPSRRRGRCTDTLRTARDDIENASTNFRNCLHTISTSGNSATGPIQHSETPSELQPQPNTPLIRVDYPSESLEPSRTLQTKPAEQTVGAGHETSHPTSLTDSSPGPAKKTENRSKTREGALIAARETFKAVEAMSGAIPGVGGFVGIAAKVGSAFVNMIETMDKNEDVSEELASHTSKLSTYLERFKKNVGAEKGDEVAGHVEDLRKELECVQQKVKTWQSSGRFKKLLLSSDHAEELKANQDSVQTALEEMQARSASSPDLLVSLKITDLVVELKDTGLRAERTRLLDRLGNGSYGASRRAIEDVVCLPGTRVDLLDRIDVWIKDTSPSAQPVLWIRGMAGRGKSAIASSVAHNWASKGSSAIFHFRRGQNALDDRFLCALARQLGKALVPEVKNAILDCVRENEDIAKERLEQQFKTIFVGSLGKIHGHAHPIVIIVDALDECEDVNYVERFVRLLDQHASLFPVNVKFLLTCRPEIPLIVALELTTWPAEDLESASHVSEDITRFLRHAFTQIRERWKRPKTWPSSDDFEKMVGMSQGLFQWARTAATYIGDRAPEHRLRELLQHPSKWAKLDGLYHQILSRAFEEAGDGSERQEMLRLVLGTIVVAPYPEDIDEFLRQDILAGLNSLVHIPTSSSEPVRLMHTSIRDLLSAQERCENERYFVDLVPENGRLARLSLQIMQHNLKQNICNHRVPKANSEIEDEVNHHVSSGLRYCCRSWSIHLAAGLSLSDATRDAASIVLEKFKVFSDEKLLSWLEIMSLIGAMTEAYRIAKEVNQWLLVRIITE